MLRVKKLLLFISCLVALRATAQKNPYGEVSISSPNAASLGKYADIPVNYHTGIPQVSIPIYAVQEGLLSLPVSLSYHAGGIKVMEPASWVGTGWSLSAGGVITRTVMGAPDEKGTSNVDNHSHGYFSDYGYHNYLYNGTDLNGRPFSNWTPFAEGKKDGEPDLFFFNFAGYSGKFYFQDDRTPVMVPEQDVKIQYNYTGSGSISSFIITTPDGTKYHFGKTAATNDVDPVEITNPITEETGLQQGTVISSWYLNKIVSADDNFSITLTYAAENYAFYMLSMFPIPFSTLSGGPNPNFSPTYEYKLIKNVVNGVRLSSIQFSNGQVNFIPGALRLDLGDNSIAQVTPDYVTDEAKTLGTIEITNNNNACKKFIFNYNYFEDNTSDYLPGALQIYGNSIQTDKKRLKLTSLQEVSCDNSIANPAHVFEYASDFMPRRLSFAQDHWGFYNGANGNQTLIPTYTVNNYNIVSGANRNPNFPAMQAGALQKIIYPTGGYSQFAFEANSTWINRTARVANTTWQKTLGYGSVNPYSYQETITLAAGDYQLSLMSNTVEGSIAGLSLTNSNNVTVAVISAQPGQNYSQSFSNIPAGQYTVTISKDCPSSNAGVTGNVSIWGAATIAENQPVGGLRIKTITHHDGATAENKVLNFKYDVHHNEQDKSTGILYSKPVYVQVLRNDLIRDVGYWNPTSGFTAPTCGLNGCMSCGTTLEYYKSPSSIRPMETTQGNHIGYKEVTVYETGNGRSVYRYSGANPWEFTNEDVAVTNVNTKSCEASIPNYPAAPLAHNFLRGELEFEAHYAEGGQQPIRRVNYVPVFVNNPKATPAFIVTSKGVGGQATQYLGTYYQLNTAKKTQTTITETIRDANGTELTTTRVSYNESPYHTQPTRNVTTGSDGKIKESLVKYAFDFRISDCDAITDCTPQLNSDNAACLSTFNAARLVCINGPSNQRAACLTNAYINYMYCQSQARISYVNCRKTNFTNSTNAFATCKLNAKSNADASLQPVLEMQDIFNNAPVEMSEWRDGKLLSATFNQYNYAPTGTSVYPDKMYAINLKAPSATFTASSNTNTSLSKDGRYEHEAAVKFSQGNLVELKAKTGVTTSYIWGVNNTLPIVRAVGIDYATLKSAYDAVSGNLSQIRSQTSLQPAMVSTYTYTPLVGMTSEADVNGRKISYEYDALQRLRLIRDKDNSILKQFSYGYQAYLHSNAVWQVTGSTRCKPCSTNSAFITNVLQAEERDINPESAGFGNTRWTDLNESASCVVAAWQNTTTPARCRVVNGQNTGEQEQEQKDMNPCSATYNTLRWIITGVNTTSCPIPVVYAKITYDNPTLLGYNVYEDVIVSFFEDAACTIPASVTNLSIVVKEEIYSSYTGQTNYQYYTYTCNGTSQLIIPQALRYYDDGNGGYETYKYKTIAGQGYLPNE